MLAIMVERQESVDDNGQDTDHQQKTWKRDITKGEKVFENLKKKKKYQVEGRNSIQMFTAVNRNMTQHFCQSNAKKATGQYLQRDSKYLSKHVP